jgi:hypothetical protein
MAGGWTGQAGDRPAAREQFAAHCRSANESLEPNLV